MSNLIVPILIDGPPVAGADGGAENIQPIGQVFHPFPRLPPEIRQQIWLEALHLPVVAYFSLKPRHFTSPLRIPALKPRKGRGIPTYKGWASLVEACPEAQEAVQRILLRRELRPFEKAANNPAVTYDNTLIVVDLALKHAPYPWNLTFSEHRDTVYDNIGRGVRYVGLRWQPARAVCRGHEQAFMELAGIPSMQCHEIPRGLGRWQCLHHAPCQAIAKAYIRYFRDAEVIYIMVHMLANDLRRRGPGRMKAGVVEKFTQEIVRLQQAKNLHRWEDGHFKWYEVDAEDAEALASPKRLQPWAMAQSFRAFYQHLEPEAMEGTNPAMSFKVLVTTTALQRNKEAEPSEKEAEPVR